MSGANKIPLIYHGEQSRAASTVAFFERMVEKHPELFSLPVQVLRRGADSPAYRAVSDSERAEMVRLAEAGYSGHAIADKLGRSQHTVQKWLVVFKMRGLIGDVRALRARRTGRMTEGECTRILRMGRAGKSCREIAQALRRSETTVFRLLAPIGVLGPRGGSLAGLRARMVEMAREGRTYGEIAKALGCSATAVADHLRGQDIPARIGGPGRPRSTATKLQLQPVAA